MAHTLITGNDSNEKGLDFSIFPIKNVPYQMISRAQNILGVFNGNEQITGCVYEKQNRGVHIDAFGRVILCCMDWGNEHILGDVNSETITKIFNGEKYKAIRERMKSSNDKKFLCNRCEWAKVQV